ncbi:magnesium transporter [Endobacter medicaginis]|uniref:Magnesium transport protein CorA n=1 Tax=Endobacter medicaginis TaxID=1181271 RepID=A0A850NWE0_9PROT|nr:magnesium transporter CorA family protein [Endobacter medicaginis]MBB3172243.1 magnesium transporter [Endobacter medicaginis]MCX5474637.1 magnesium transporter CorA family protein [Endobacter medicaginis]NVN31148.1 magnesium transporter CorA family protein [Endobacter medicaginis]
MILAHPPRIKPFPVTSPAEADQAVWLDLLDPSPEDIRLVEAATGLEIPTRADLEEIETSSRQYREGDVLYLSMTLLRRVEGGVFKGPLGFVLSRDHLLSLRYTDYPVFQLFSDRLAKGEEHVGSSAMFVGLLEAIIDRLADILEHTGGELDRLSRRIFNVEAGGRLRRPERQHDRAMRLTLAQIGRTGELVSAVRDSLLGVQRICSYLADNTFDTCPAAIGQRLQTLQRDVGSLTDYENQCMEKVHFLLDATLGFINIDQNGGLRLLTVVSFIGVPPTLVASIYGMNFEHMPELHWHYGYFYALALMAVTICLPLLWFWRKGWLGRSA